VTSFSSNLDYRQKALRIPQNKKPREKSIQKISGSVEQFSSSRFKLEIPDSVKMSLMIPTDSRLNYLWEFGRGVTYRYVAYRLPVQIWCDVGLTHQATIVAVSHRIGGSIDLFLMREMSELIGLLTAC
jgi:hypothetical protein